MSLLVLSSRNVRELLPAAECIEHVATAMKAASAGEVLAPPRLFTPLVDGSAAFGLMPASAADPPTYGAKVISLHRDNPPRGLPAVQGFVALFGHDSGTPLALVEASEVTAIRTAAASALATRELARRDARTHGVLGTGVQARSHLEAVAVVRSIDQALLWGRDAAKTNRLAKQWSEELELDVRPVTDRAQASACDIVSTVTGSEQPIVSSAEVRAGSHLNVVGAHTPDAREVDSELVARAALYTDLLESLHNEAGEYLIPLREGRIEATHPRGEIGQLLLGEIAGRQNDDEITLYKSLGVAAQDLFSAFGVYEKARRLGVGQEVDF